MVDMLIYSELAKPIADGKPVKLSFAVLTKAKTPGMFLHPVHTDPREVNRTKHIVERIWHAFKPGISIRFPAP